VTTVPSDPQNTLREGIIELTVCPWKGQASYIDVEVEGQVNRALPGTTRPPKKRRGHQGPRRVLERRGDLRL